MRISVIGVGLMGQALAKRLVDAGHEVTVYNRTRAKLTEAAQGGARIAETPKHAIAAAEIVVLLLTDALAIEEVIASDGETLAALADKTIIQMGTIAPRESLALASKVRAVRAVYLEAPVLGSVPEAKSGNLLVMVGATAEEFANSAALLQTFGPGPIWTGPVGTAAAMKLALNQLIASLTAAFSLSLALVVREGIDVETFMAVLRRSAVYAPTFDKKLPRMLTRDFANPNFPAKHLLKDVELFLQEAKHLCLETAALEGLRTVLTKTAAAGLSDDDYSALYNVINPKTP